MISSCFGCRLPSLSGICKPCASRLPFESYYCIGERTDEIECLLDDFKFNRCKRIYKTFGQLLHQSLPALPPDTVVVPVATIPKHIRVRGYDHTDLIARDLARRRTLKKVRLLRRKTNTVQLGANARLRRTQAEAAYSCAYQLSSDVPYLLVDDIATTGATLVAAARCLRRAGAQTIMAAVIARQPLKP